MTKYLLAIVAVVGFGTVACGGNDCEDAANRIADAISACSSASATETSTSTSTEQECTEELAAAAQKAADCIESVDYCKVLSGDVDEATKYAECSK